MRSGSIIRHQASMDVAFNIIRIRGPYGPNQKFELKGEWINMGFVRSWPLGITQKIRLSRKDFSSWEICLTPEVDCLRYGHWKQIA